MPQDTAAGPNGRRRRQTERQNRRRRTWVRRLGTLFVVSVLLAGAPLYPVIGGQAGTDRPLIGTALGQEATGSFEEHRIHVTRGTEATIAFTHSKPAVLYVTNERIGYLLEVAVGGDGTDTVTIDTYSSTSAVASDYVEGGTARLIRPGDGLDRSLPPGEYTLTLSVDGRTVDLASLIVEKRPEVGMRILSAPREISPGDLDQDELLKESTARRTVVKGDYAVMAIDTPGLGSVIDPDALRGDNASNGINVSFEDTRPESTEEGASFNASGNPAVTTMWNEETARLILVWNTGRVTLYNGSHTYRVSVRLNAAYNKLVTNDTVAATGTIHVVKPSITLRTESELDVYPWEDRRLRLAGSTNYVPGHELAFQIATTDPVPRFRRARVTVPPDGTFETAIDVSGFPAGTHILRVYEHLYKAEWPVRIRRPTASLSMPDQSLTEQTRVAVENVDLSVGGFVVVSGPGGNVLGVAGPLPEGHIGTIEVPIRPRRAGTVSLTATAYMDWNQNDAFDANADRTYTTDAGPVSANARVTIPERFVPTTIPTSTTTETTKTQETTVPTTLSVRHPAPITPVTTTPGTASSGAVSAIAILVTALLFIRQRE